MAEFKDNLSWRGKPFLEVLNKSPARAADKPVLIIGERGTGKRTYRQSPALSLFTLAGAA